MNPTNDLVPVLKKLRLSGVLETLPLRLRQVADDNLPSEEFLFRLLSDEVERREAKQLRLRMRRADFEQHCALEDFDFDFNPDIPKAKIIDLATCAFIERRENLVLEGEAGLGKSHIAQAFGQRACRAGYTVLFSPGHQIFKDLRAARADASYDRKLLRYTGPNLLIIDELLLRPLNHNEPEDLHEIVRQRYERGSTIITSNRAVEEWMPFFGDPLLASATMDRLLHHAHRIGFQGDSYRNPPPQKADRVARNTKRRSNQQ
jgi:DNA replication protein DnaC